MRLARRSQMQAYIEHLESEVAALRADLAQARTDLAQARARLTESQGMYQSMVIPTLTRAQEANREYVRHLRHCPDPDAGSTP